MSVVDVDVDAKQQHLFLTAAVSIFQWCGAVRCGHLALRLIVHTYVGADSIYIWGSSTLLYGDYITNDDDRRQMTLGVSLSACTIYINIHTSGLYLFRGVLTLVTNDMGNTAGDGPCCGLGTSCNALIAIVFNLKFR